jgi:hypothetical protein
MRGLDRLIGRAQRRDHDRHPEAHAHVEVVREPRVRRMHDLVDRVRRDLALGMRALPRVELGGDPCQPLLERRFRPRIQRRKAADDAGLALLDHERRMGDDEKRRADRGQAQPALQQCGQGHRGLVRGPRALYPMLDQ